MKHIMTMGGIWRLSERNYRKLLRDIKTGHDIDLDQYGKLIITDPINLADLQQEHLDL